ncbi:MAG TPA: NAD-dependent deacylase [Fulvivirga sp.]|nr:NAD-dependent deacylase [Fulvivirga sp.]
MLKLVVLSGAGVSAESGIPTFRDAGGLWEGHDVMEVASPQGWQKNPELVLDFYNKRRAAAAAAKPNEGHLALASLEEDFDVTVITQNIDNLHEQAGSSNVIHLHGLLSQARSSIDENMIYDIGTKDINLGDLCKKGSQLRPNIVWFGEMVPMIEKAAKISEQADIFIVVGTSLAVYPAASLIDYVPYTSKIYVVDPNMPYIKDKHNIKLVNAKATTGLKEIAVELKANYH